MRSRQLVIFSILLLFVTASLVCWAFYTTLWETSVTIRVEDNPLTSHSSQLTVYCNPQPMEFGHVSSILGKLINATSGAPIASQTVYLSFRTAARSSWTTVGSVQTTVDGSYSLVWSGSNSLGVGIYVVNATFLGNAQFDPWSAMADFQIIPSRHDLAVLSIACPHNIVGQNYSTSFVLTVDDEGAYQETSNVTLFGRGNLPNTNDTAQIDYWSNLTVGTNSPIILNCVWNATSPFNNYTVVGHVDVVRYETQTANNNCTISVTVTIPGDINGDFSVDLGDLVLLAKAYNTVPGNSKWNPNADINGDNFADLGDLVIMARHYGQHYP